jgi:glycine/D-amino acid oxidase-like deaminating enzyme
MTPDKLPYVGALTPGNSRILVATGFSKWKMRSGTAAAALLRYAVTGRDNPLAGIDSSNRRRLGACAAGALENRLRRTPRGTREGTRPAGAAGGR